MPDLIEAVAWGDRLATLEALAAVLAARIDDSDSARDVAALSGQLVTVSKQIGELKQGNGPASTMDELAAKRKERRKPVRNGKARGG